MVPVARRRRRGGSQMFLVASLPVLAAFCSLGTDYARVQLVKSELRAAADAAARAGASGLSSGQAVSRACAAALENTADGTPVQLLTTAPDGSDVVLGRWDATTATFYPSGTPTNAVQVTARRTTARGNATRLSFAGLIGMPTCDAQASAIAVASLSGYAVVGLNYVTMSGNSSDSYWSSTGYVRNSTGHIASNGNITLSGSSYIYGDARPGPGMSVNDPSKVGGSVAPLTQPLSYPNGSAGTYATVNDNAQIPAAYYLNKSLLLGSGANVTLPGGNYYLNTVSLSGSAVLNFSGPATLYCYGSVVMSGNVMTSLGNPGNLRIVMVPTPTGGAPGPVTVSSSSALYGTIYAPQSDVVLSGSGDIYGSVLGRSVSMTGTSGIHYDLAQSGGSGSITVVK